MNATNPKWPSPPEDIEGEALLEWDRICGEIERMGLGDKLYGFRAILVVYVAEWALWQKAKRHCDSEGEVVVFPNGIPGANPWQKIRKETGAMVQSLLRDLNATPATHKLAPNNEQLDLKQAYSPAS